jgi:hypothetical protein
LENKGENEGGRIRGNMKLEKKIGVSIGTWNRKP